MTVPTIVILLIIVLTILSLAFGFTGIYILTSIGWSFIFISFFTFVIMCILGYLARK